MAIIICVPGSHELLQPQIKNILTKVKCLNKLYFVDTSDKSGDPLMDLKIGLNKGIERSWQDCSSFLFLSNDMFFLDDFVEPKEEIVYVPRKEGSWRYPWPNLLYFKKSTDIKHVDFFKCPESGVSISLGGNLGLQLFTASQALIQEFKDRNFPFQHMQYRLNNCRIVCLQQINPISLDYMSSV